MSMCCVCMGAYTSTRVSTGVSAAYGVRARAGARGQQCRGTLAGLLLGAERITLVTEAGIGAWQVPAACLPAGISICTLIHICKRKQSP